MKNKNVFDDTRASTTNRSAKYSEIDKIADRILCKCKYQFCQFLELFYFHFLQENDENFALCESYALARIFNHRYLSVNSHEIRRRIDGLAERFMADNYTKYGERFRELCDSLIDDPLCVDHYEYDIPWILLHLLLELSKNPVGALAANKNRIRLLGNEADYDDDGQEVHVQSEKDRIMNDLISSLIRQNIPIDEGIESHGNGLHDNDSDLSVSLRFLCLNVNASVQLFLCFT